MTLIIIALVFVVGFYFYFRYLIDKSRFRNLKEYKFHSSVKNKLKLKHPELKDDQIHLAFAGLRDYFWVCVKAKGKFVSMPSQIVDDAWHEFILHTRQYDDFCKRCIGRFLHHNPAETLKSNSIAREGITRAWFFACKKESIDPKNPIKLPLLFAIDRRLNIKDGFFYSTDCQNEKNKNSNGISAPYCASDIGCNSGDSMFDSWGSSDSGSGCGSHGCGSGCGGGCGGGD